MSSFMDRLLGRSGLEDEYDAYDEMDDYSEAGTEYLPEQFAEEPEASRNQVNFRQRDHRSGSRIVDLNQAKNKYQKEVVIIEPRNIRDAQKVCDDVKAGKIVVCNLERIDPVITQRVIDFITGGTYALSGGVTSVSNYIFIASPSTAAVYAQEADQVAAGDEAENPVASFVRRAAIQDPSDF